MRSLRSLREGRRQKEVGELYLAMAKAQRAALGNKLLLYKCILLVLCAAGGTGNVIWRCCVCSSVHFRLSLWLESSFSCGAGCWSWVRFQAEGGAGPPARPSIERV